MTSRTKTSAKETSVKRRPRLPSIAVLNARFQAMTLAEKRRAIANDALERLSTGQIKPTPRKWVNIPTERPSSLPSNLQLLLRRRNAPTCQACALGAVIVGLAAFENEVTLCPSGTGIGTSFYRNAPRLRDLFGMHQLQLIETCFERGHGHTGTDLLSYTDESACRAFANRYLTPRALFKAIFTRIAKDPEGVFRP
jgi:hypothetical protein